MAETCRKFDQDFKEVRSSWCGRPLADREGTREERPVHRCAARCLSSGHSSRVSRDIVRILVSGVMGNVDGAGCDHSGGGGGPAQERGGAGLRGVPAVGAEADRPVSRRG